MERRKDNKGRVLRKGESQRKDLTYMFRYKDIDEKRKSIYAKTLDELRKKEVVINKNLDLGIGTNELTLNQVFEKYLEQNVNLKERTRYKYKTEYDYWVGNKWLGKKKIQKIVKSDIVKFYKEMSKEGYANGTIQCCHKHISGALNMAYEDDMIRRNYAISCIKPYLATGKREAMTKEETNKFLSTAENVAFGKTYLLAFKLMLLSGMRVGEITGLTWKDVNLKEKYIDVNHQFVTGDEKSRTAYHIDTPKTSAGCRKVPISDDLYTLLNNIKSESYFDAFESNAEVDGYKGFVIHTRKGLPIQPCQLNVYAKRVVEIYNETHDDKLPHITCHTCRHTFCTRMAELNVNPHVLQKIVGHSSYQTTADVYISVKDDFVNEEFFKAMRGVS